MTRDQWIAIFDSNRHTFIVATNSYPSTDTCSAVSFLHGQKDLLVEEVIRVQRHNIRKLIDQQELPLVNDFFKDIDSSVGSSRDN